MTDVFSPKQKSALGLVKSGGLRRINLLEGSVRSGKTWISMIMWGFWVASAPENGAYLMAGKTLTTMRRNVLEPMCGLFGSCFTYSLSKRRAGCSAERSISREPLTRRRKAKYAE